jgi:hypothetical protein
VRDFSGGLVNSVANALMQDNQLVMMENYDVDPLGNLRRRPGLAIHHTDAWSGSNVEYIFPYPRRNKALLLTREHPSRYGDDSLDASINVITLCDESLGDCTTFTWQGLYRWRHEPTVANSKNFGILNNKLFLSQSNSELVLFEGSVVFPARVLAPGQLRVAKTHQGGPLTGNFRYCYFYVDYDTDDTSHPSAFSWFVDVEDGVVLLYDIEAPADARADSIVICRQPVAYQRVTRPCWFPLDRIAASQTYFVDTFVTTDDSIFADDDQCYMAEPTYADPPNDPCFDTSSLRPPGGMSIQIDTLVGDSGIACGALGCRYAHYSVMFIDSGGRWSKLSAPTTAEISDSNDVNYRALLTNIPTMTTSYGCKEKLLLRYTTLAHFHPRVIATLDCTTSTYVDSLRCSVFDTLAVIDTVYCKNTSDPAILLNNYDFGYYYCRDDSLIPFKPISVVLHGSRIWALRDYPLENIVYYSDFGRPTTWPGDHFISIPSRQGDWFLKMVSISDDELVLFRHNSVVNLTGLTFYQYNISEVIRGAGLTAPQSLSHHKNKLYFAHSTGVYSYGSILSGDSKPLSWAIKNTVDSIGADLSLSHGHIIDDEYWWSVAIDDNLNDKTYIWSEFPIPHWKCYTFGLQDAVAYDNDTTVLDYQSERYILLGSNDTLYRWGYTDTLGYDEPSAEWSARMKTKAFLEGPGRKKILWVELLGSESIDNLKVTYWDKLGTDSLKTDIYDALFDDDEDNRRVVNEIVSNLSVSIDDSLNTWGNNYTIQGIRFGWIPWDEGKKE